MNRRQRTLRAKRAARTRAFYRAEEKLVVPRRLMLERSMGALRRFMRRVWKAEADPRQREPKLVGGRGSRNDPKGRLHSYVEGSWYFHTMVLSRDQRCRFILLHELAHTLGPSEHNLTFTRLLRRLLVTYGGMDDAKLEASFGMFGVRT